jgi:Zn-dependent peptidase ImmA (M78 family)
VVNPIFFRSFQGALKGERLVQKARLLWLEDITAVAEHYAYLPEVDVPDLMLGRSFKTLRNEDFEALAFQVREYWALGQRPIHDMVALLESKGVIVGSEPMETTQLDGLSRWGSDGRPYVLLASDKQSFARRQYDSAHELAHLVLHRGVSEGEVEDNLKTLEDQAHRFASALLLPESQYAVEIDKVNIWELERQKVRWRVSIKAQIMRLQRLGLLDASLTTKLYKTYSAKGYQSQGEPYDDVWPLQQPSILADVFKTLIDAGQVSKEALRLDLPLLPHDVESLAGLPTGWLTMETARVVALRPEVKSRRSDEHSSGGIVYRLPTKG